MKEGDRNYIAERVKELQEEIDGADPFLVDWVSAKSDDEIHETLVKMQKELDFIGNVNNPMWYEEHSTRKDTIRAIYELRSLMKDKNIGGHSIA